MKEALEDIHFFKCFFFILWVSGKTPKRIKNTIRNVRIQGFRMRFLRNKPLSRKYTNFVIEGTNTGISFTKRFQKKNAKMYQDGTNRKAILISVFRRVHPKVMQNVTAEIRRGREFEHIGNLHERQRFVA